MRKIKYNLHNDEYYFNAEDLCILDYDEIISDKITPSFIREYFNSSNFVVDHKSQEIIMYDVGLSKYYHNLKKYKYSK